MHAVQIENLSFSYEQSDELVIKNIDLNVEEGEFICVLGQSGCGKSTFLRLLAGLEMAKTGNILLDGEPIKGASLDRGVVFQDYGLFPWMKAGENISLALKQKFPKSNKNSLKNIALNSLKEVGLDPSVYNKYPKELSGGMKQRCAIAQAFSMNPPILLMDEPFGALDAVTRARLQDLLLKLWSQENPKKTIFFITHDVDEALLLGSRVIVLGQSPSEIIYECSIPKDISSPREEILTNPDLIKIRNELIMQLNKNISSYI